MKKGWWACRSEWWKVGLTAGTSYKRRRKRGEGKQEEQHGCRREDRICRRRGAPSLFSTKAAITRARAGEVVTSVFAVSEVG